jgi:pullulanase-type alpha-1,6-glucosidase
VSAQEEGERQTGLTVTAPGSYNAEIGCNPALGAEGDWAPDCSVILLTDDDGDGVYVLVNSSIPAGNYEVKVAINRSWSENYGANGARDGGNILFEVPVDYAEVTFSWDSGTKILDISINPEVIGGPVVIEQTVSMDLNRQEAHWVSADTIIWDVGEVPEGATFQLYYSPDARLVPDTTGFLGGSSAILTLDPSGVSAEIAARFPHLAGGSVLKLNAAEVGIAARILRSQLGVVMLDANGEALGGTGLQIPGVLDDLFYYDGPLGVTYDDDIPTIRVWAPTAQQVLLKLFDDSNPETDPRNVTMRLDPTTGVWSAIGEADWTGKYYLYDVRVFAPSVQQVVNNLVTDPYSVSLSLNSTRTQIIDVQDAALAPAEWDATTKPTLAAPEDIVLYELHVRDFSISDETVPEADRGTFRAFTHTESNGMQHLINLANAGLTHIHLLPVFDIATINEDRSAQETVDPAELAALPPDSEEQQALLNPVRDLDGFNWGYDPYHYNVPEGSYSTTPDGTARILEFREMVQALNSNGLRVVMDVVYNHTNSSGQADRSVLDRIVPGYYHRLNDAGGVASSTCCANTATEHRMMERLMVDSVVLWATVYKVDGFRFDLMGHHMRSNMEAVRAALDGLTLEADGVDGRSIYVYGEGWNFGEVQDNARGVNATQLNMGGTGIGTFNDRLRDAVRGGSPFGGWQDQGFAQGLAVDPNGLTAGTPEEQMARLMLLSDHIRVGLAGNLADYSFQTADGSLLMGRELIYNGAPAGYTLDPQEHIVYVSAHDNETIFDAIQEKAPESATMPERVRMQILANSISMFSQGVPFFHAGDDILRSKSGDRNSYNSGDWFNRLDFTYVTNNWGVGLPPAGDNQDRWAHLQPLLADLALAVTNEDIEFTARVFQEQLAIRRSSPLFRLQTAEEVIARLSFQNTGPDQLPGLIVMTLDDSGDLTDLDPNYSRIVLLFNASPEPQSFAYPDAGEMSYTLHPLQAESVDVVLQGAAYAEGTFTVPGRTAAIFVVNQ